MQDVRSPNSVFPKAKSRFLPFRCCGGSPASARPLPAIIDTPMARLDAKHRQKLVERYFPHASHQVVILSTDTEIERKYFYDLQPHIARAYHLNYDEKSKATTAEEGYFWDVRHDGEAVA